ncbi:uncharacterized protein LOC123503505 isoform X2 [Portunus trituberculatus]|uniref:uncharacterized protein LOC123503505 isoform X2 n=1 Tax=Portunus trituberculatus TaxID=210409 RepID=UPI001E1D0B2D|nr:uncharacterized protein LOC123503505 isoform X2 [Portunus trituberculatus]XP_045109280.1 uncharacterized protein LOC123503505 isoform X2 [Portunus trituberculatus]
MRRRGVRTSRIWCTTLWAPSTVSGPPHDLLLPKLPHQETSQNRATASSPCITHTTPTSTTITSTTTTTRIPRRTHTPQCPCAAAGLNKDVSRLSLADRLEKDIEPPPSACVTPTSDSSAPCKVFRNSFLPRTYSHKGVMGGRRLMKCVVVSQVKHSERSCRVKQ